MKFLALAQMLGEALEHFVRRHLERVADPKQGKQGAGPSRLDHLPVAHGEAVGNHVLLAQFARGPVLTYAVAQRAEEVRITGREFSAGTHGPILPALRAKIPRAKMRIRAIVPSRVKTTPMPLAQKTRDQAPSCTPHPVTRVFMRRVLMLALCLAVRPPLHAQSPVFVDTPNEVIHFIVASHPEMPARTSMDIAVIEINSPDYLASSDKAYRYRRLDDFITYEAWRLKGEPDMRGQWYEFIEAKAPDLTESEIDAIARQWWSDNGNQAEVHLDRGGWKKAIFSEVRERFQTFRTGNETQVRAAKNWLMMAQMADHWECFTIPPQMQGMSLLAHLLARDIAQEAMAYKGEQAEKLRRTVRSLLADKFKAEGEAGIARIVSSSDVEAILDGLSSGDQSTRRSATERLEEWLKKAVETDLKRYARVSSSHR